MNFEILSLEEVTQCAQSLDRESLLLQTKALVDKERDLTAKTLVLFKEIENRRLHFEMGFGSLFDLLVHHFGLSEGCASRRVASVKLMSQVPEVEQKIRDGELSLSNVAAAQRFFTAEAKNDNPLDLEQKREVLNSLVGKSVREGERELIQRSSLPICLQVPDQVKPKGEEHVEIRFLAPQGLADLLEEAKGLLAHRLPHGASIAEVIQVMTEMGIERIKKERFGVGSKPRVDSSQPEAAEKVILDKSVDIGADVSEVETTETRSRHIPLPVRREVYLRAGGKCEYVDRIVGRRCNSSSFLEFDHLLAYAKGGRHTSKGIILTCRHHNELRARKDFGAWIDRYRKSANLA